MNACERCETKARLGVCPIFRLVVGKPGEDGVEPVIHVKGCETAYSPGAPRGPDPSLNVYDTTHRQVLLWFYGSQIARLWTPDDNPPLQTLEKDG